MTFQVHPTLSWHWQITVWGQVDRLLPPGSSSHRGIALYGAPSSCCLSTRKVSCLAVTAQFHTPQPLKPIHFTILTHPQTTRNLLLFYNSSYVLPCVWSIDLLCCFSKISNNKQCALGRLVFSSSKLKQHFQYAITFTSCKHSRGTCSCLHF